MNESKTSHSYIIVMGIEPMTVGDLYQHELHSTLLHWFNSEYTSEQIGDLIRPVFRDTEPFSIVSGKVANFGDNDDLLVNLVDKSADLKKLHNRIVHVLEAIKVTYLRPEYVGEGWRPHVTVQGSKQLSQGQSVVIQEAYLIECPNGPEKPPIMVRVKFRFGDENAA